MTPLKQIKSGVMLQDVKCREGLVLVIKELDQHPACVKSTSEQRLLTHGWITIEKFETMVTINNETGSTGHQNMMQVLNQTSNAHGADSFSNSVSWTKINKLYHEYLTNGSADIAKSGEPLPPLSVNYTVSSNNPNDVKILTVGMSPYQLKVGDEPAFTVSYQNISSRTIYHSMGCTASSLGMIILPSDNVTPIFPSLYPLCANYNVPVNPKQISTDGAGLFTQDPNGRNLVPSIHSGDYKILKAGTLHVRLGLYLWNAKGWVDTYETIQFNVNATQ
ncbi:MAG TPA: hypothetical protein VFG24_06955 [Nitrosopumilaceae archaeon]|nr:hypothetical protein [Nitrosopumilaceae archaeon]